MIGIRLYSPLCEEPPRSPTKGRQLPKALTESQEAALIQCCRDQCLATRKGLPARRYRPPRPPCPKKIAASDLDLFIFQFGLATGLRSQELRDLQISEIDLTGQSVFVDHGKGNKQRYVPLADALVPIVRAWIGGRKEGCLLTYRGRGPMADETLYWRVRRMGKRALIPFVVHPHTLRHTFATRIYELTRDIRVVQELLGHEDISTTQIYAACAPSLMLEAVNLKYPKPVDEPDEPA